MERDDELSRKLDNVLYELEMKGWRACERMRIATNGLPSRASEGATGPGDD